MKNIWIVPIEPIDQRYTAQWYVNIPKIFKERITELGLDSHNIRIVDGVQSQSGTTSGAFLDFAVTNVYKASQAQRIAEAFAAGEVQAGDIFLITDAWNFVITPIKYMSDLLKIPVEIHGIWHAGAYDPTDILGYQMQKPWPWHVEQSWFHACDYNYYATEFHRSMFMKNLNIDTDTYGHKAIRSGQPHDPLIAEISVNFDNTKRNGAVMWPHRYNSDKQPDIAEDLAKQMPVTITQKMSLNKSQYYEAMSEHSVIFSCALHENLGISVMEAVLSGVIPVLPRRCSYAEMYLDEFLYPSEWTENWEQYQLHQTELAEFINDRIQNRDQYLPALAKQKDILVEKYLTATTMFDNILKSNGVGSQ